MINPLDIYARATRRLPLTPAERAFLKTAQMLLLSAVAGAVVSIAQSLLTHKGQPLTFGDLAQIGAYAAATALLAGLAKLFNAQGDVVSQAIAGALDEAEQAVGRQAPSASRGNATPPPSLAVRQFARYNGPSQPLSKRLSGMGTAGSGSGSFPPVMPDTPRSRADLLAQIGGVSLSQSQPGAHTRPTAAVSPATSVPDAPVGSPSVSMPSQPPSATSAPSPREDALPETVQRPAVGEDDGPPTQEVPVVSRDKWVR